MSGLFFRSLLVVLGLLWGTGAAGGGGAYAGADFVANTSDNYFDIIIHFKNNKFVIAREGNLLQDVKIEDLVSIIDATPSGKTVRLLSCNNTDAAELLSSLTQKPFYASDGWVDLYKTGAVRSGDDFYLFEKGVKKTSQKINKNTEAVIGAGVPVRLGEELTSEIVSGSVKRYLINGIEVGSAKISTSGFIGFDIKIPTLMQKKGYATQIFEDAIGFYKNQNKVVNGIEGKWLSNNSYEGGMSTNLKSFIDDYLNNGKTFEEAALNTPTGKIASKNGFIKVVKSDWEILDLGGSRPAQIYWIEVKFKKP